jgi:hypothetical protein
MAALGITANRTSAQRDLMSKVFSGELSGKSLRALAAGDPKALAELHDMIATAENRATTKKSFEDIFGGTQYNSVSKSKLGTTLANYEEFGPAVRSAVDQFYDPTANVMNTPDATNYYNPSISDPSWGSKMGSPTKQGEHKFGILNGPYDNPLSGDFKTERDRMAEAQKADPSGFTGHKDYSGSGYSSRMDSPTEGSLSNRGGTYSGKDYTSPAEGSRTTKGGTYTGKDYTSPTEGSVNHFGSIGLGTPDKDKDRDHQG